MPPSSNEDTQSPTSTDDPFEDVPEDTPDIEPDITVMEVRGEKEIGFMGMKHLELPEEEKDKIHNVYADIIIELDDIKDEFMGADRAWHIGRVMAEHSVDENDDMTLADLGAFNTIDDMYARRLQYARNIYEFWPDKQYDPGHSVTALAELASRATGKGEEETARAGYERILNAGEDLTKTDVLLWDKLESRELAEVVAITAAEYKRPDTIAATVKRLWLLTDQSTDNVQKSDVENLIREELTD
jgi:hypothetical protein